MDAISCYPVLERQKSKKIGRGNWQKDIRSKSNESILLIRSTSDSQVIRYSPKKYFGNSF
jgi:hypothetical protein